MKIKKALYTPKTLPNNQFTVTKLILVDNIHFGYKVNDIFDIGLYSTLDKANEYSNMMNNI